MDQYEVDFTVNLTLEPAVLNVVLAALEEFPLPSKVYKKVVGTIQEQVYAQAKERHEQRSSQAGSPTVGGEGSSGQGLDAIQRLARSSDDRVRVPGGSEPGGQDTGAGG